MQGFREDGPTTRCTGLTALSFDRSHRRKAARRSIRYQINGGFRWTEELSALLAEYEANRNQYPTLESFFPRIITFFNEYAEKIAA
jgi:hypothetical protein